MAKITYKTIIIALIVIALALFVLNQTLSYIYKVEFLMNACELCMEQGNECRKIIPIRDLLINITK